MHLTRLNIDGKRDIRMTYIHTEYSRAADFLVFFEENFHCFLSLAAISSLVGQSSLENFTLGFIGIHWDYNTVIRVYV